MCMLVLLLDEFVDDFGRILSAFVFETFFSVDFNDIFFYVFLCVFTLLLDVISISIIVGFFIKF